MFAPLVQLAVVVLVFTLLYWLVGQLGLPEPIRKVVNIVLVVLTVILLVEILLQLPLGVGAWKGLHR